MISPDRPPLWTEVLETSMAALDDAALQRVIDRVDLAFALGDAEILSSWTPELTGKGRLHEVTVFLLYVVAQVWAEKSVGPMDSQRNLWQWIWSHGDRVTTHTTGAHVGPLWFLCMALVAVRSYLRRGYWLDDDNVLPVTVLDETGHHSAQALNFRFVLPGWNEQEKWIEFEGRTGSVVVVDTAGLIRLVRLGEPFVPWVTKSSLSFPEAFAQARKYARRFGYKFYSIACDQSVLAPSKVVDP